MCIVRVERDKRHLGCLSCAERSARLLACVGPFNAHKDPVRFYPHLADKDIVAQRD